MNKVETIAVIGAGTMGSGIAQAASEAGYSVIMRDISDEFVHRGMTMINKNVGRAVEKGKKTEDEARIIIDRIKGTTKLADLKEADLVIEAIIENMEVKKELYKELDETCKKSSVFASNTSGLSITEMASVTSRADKVVGMHFFNPVAVMKLVEVIAGAETSAETVQMVLEVSKSMGKEPIKVNEAPLFVVNRILVPLINEAVFVLAEGVASAEDIDKGMMLGANHPIGPLALADLIGLDILIAVQDTLYNETGDSKYRACPLLRKMVRAGHLGRKSGQGFYSYA